MFKRIGYDIKGNWFLYLILLLSIAAFTVLQGFGNYFLKVYDRYVGKLVNEGGSRFQVTWESGQGYTSDIVEKINAIPGVLGCGGTEEGSYICADIRSETSLVISREYCRVYGFLNSECQYNFRNGYYSLIQGELPGTGAEVAVEKSFAETNNILVGDSLYIKNYYTAEEIEVEVKGIYEITVSEDTAYPVSDKKEEPSQSDSDVTWEMGENPYQVIYMTEAGYNELCHVQVDRSSLIVYTDSYAAIPETIKKVKNLLSNKVVEIENTIQGEIERRVPGMQTVKRMANMYVLIVSLAGIVVISGIGLYWIRKHEREKNIYSYLGMKDRNINMQFYLSLMLAAIISIAAGMVCYELLKGMAGPQIAEQFANLTGELYAVDGADREFYYESSSYVTGNFIIPYYIGMVVLSAAIISILMLGVVIKERPRFNITRNPEKKFAERKGNV